MRARNPAALAVGVGSPSPAGGPPNFDPEAVHAGGVFPAQISVHCLYDRLIHFAADANTSDGPSWNLSELRPGLAQDWEQSSDGHIVTVRLRSGVRSWRGHALTAEAVSWSWHRAFAWHAVGEWIARLCSMDGPESIEVVDSRTIRFRLRRANFLVPTLLGYYVPPIYDLEEVRHHITSADPWIRNWLTRNDAGFGPYRVEALSPSGETVTFRANPSYWEGPPKAEQVITRVGDWDSIIGSLLDGDLDVVPKVPARLVAGLRSRTGIDLVHIWKDAVDLPLRLNTQAPPFSDRRVRQAVAYAVPYKRIIDDVFRGLALPWASPLSLDPGRSTLPYSTDYAAARELLKEAGYSHGFDTQLYYLSGEDHDELIRALAESFNEVGIRIVPIQMSGVEYRANSGSIYAPKGRFPIVLRTGGHRTPVPRYALPHDFGDGYMGIGNDGGYYNPAIARLWREILSEREPLVQNEQLAQAERILVEDVPWVWLCKVVQTTALRQGVNCEHAWYPTSRPDPLFHRVSMDPGLNARGR